MDAGAASVVRPRVRLSERVAGVLWAGRPPSRGCSSINRLAPNASTAPPRAPPHFPRSRPERSRTSARRSAAAAMVLAPPIDDLLVGTHDAAAVQAERKSLQAPCGEAPRRPWGAQLSSWPEPQPEGTCSRSPSRTPPVSSRGFSSSDFPATGEPTLPAEASTRRVVAATAAAAGKRGSFPTQHENEGVAPRVLAREARPPAPLQQEEPPARQGSRQPRMPMTWADTPSPSRPLFVGLTPSTDAAGDVLPTWRPAPRPAPLLPPPPERSDIVTLLVVVKAASGAASRDGDDYHSDGTASDTGTDPRLAFGPLVVRVVLPRLLLEKACVVDLKTALEREVGVAGARQTLRADGVVLLDALPLSFLDPATILFMEPEAPAEAWAGQINLQESSRRQLLPQRERAPVPQPRVASASSLSARDCAAALERLEKCMQGSSTPPRLTTPAAAWRSSQEKTSAVGGGGGGGGSSSSCAHAVSRGSSQPGDDCIEATVYLGSGGGGEEEEEEEESAGATQDRRRRRAEDGAIGPPADTVAACGGPFFGAEEADALERPALGQRALLEDATARAQQEQMELPVWLSRRSGGGSDSPPCATVGE
ncbi:uncharacterized protein Tco025E_00333 [Trypanosoma conorhini]|uniref:Uncharacterized protein n=1 Tax=Trypanosoma conorhini TaxID=83891 RepID=A0A422QBN5_9TRYP|nr:uncharacterized protein Tco025E_00333 [Trypanosoma conorhini]RNF27403.1 hypothetical protein Tco025E_00333 [Trypanosoma conorhini]